jgi:hypothetical protein
MISLLQLSFRYAISLLQLHSSNWKPTWQLKGQIMSHISDGEGAEEAPAQQHEHSSALTEAAVIDALRDEKKELKATEEALDHALTDVKKAEHVIEAAEAAIESAHSHPHVIDFTVDGEECESERKEWSPNQIISQFGEKDPRSHYLVGIQGHHKKSFQGKGDELIELHEHARFQVICTGPTPVSDGGQHTGVAHFISGLKGMGVEAEQLPQYPDHVVFDYVVETGKFSGRTVRMGLCIPADFPLTPPSGPHIWPQIHAICPQGAHPTGAIHDNLSTNFRQSTGQDFQYWSRPVRAWNKRNVAAYMSHIWQLWDSQ